MKTAAWFCMPQRPTLSDHPCALCGALMTLVKITPGFGPLPMLKTYRCLCGHVATLEAPPAARRPSDAPTRP